VVILTYVLSACGQAEISPEINSEVLSGPTPPAAGPPMAAAPSHSEANEVVRHFPQVKEDSRGSRLASRSGELVLRDGCLQLAAGKDLYLIVWPAAASLGTPTSEIVVVDARNNASVRLGDFIEVVGAAGTKEQISSYPLRSPLPEGCSGEVWLAQRFEGPRLQRDSPND